MCKPPTYIKQILSARSTIGKIHSILSIDQLPPPLIYYLDCVPTEYSEIPQPLAQHVCLAFIKLHARENNTKLGLHEVS